MHDGQSWRVNGDITLVLLPFGQVMPVGEAMIYGQLTFTSQKLKTPRAAALAGILFAVLFSSSVVLIRLSIPANPADGGVWLTDRTDPVGLALSLLPFAGVTFLWFMGVVRDRLGYFGGPVRFDRVLWQQPAVPGHDVCLRRAPAGPWPPTL
jgi:hypothetical protein